MIKKTVLLFCVLIMAAGFFFPASAQRNTVPSYETAMHAALDWMREAVPNGPQVGGVVGEWAVRALARAERIDASTPWTTAWLNDLDKALAQIDAGVTPLSLRRWTDYQRVALALDALGLDATDYNGHDLIAPYRLFVPSAHRHAMNRTILADIYALIALESVGESNRLILAGMYHAQRADGTWSLTPSQPASVFDIDVTAMAVQALAPHYRRGEPRAVRAVHLALAWLEAQTFRDAESTAQMVTALSLLGEEYESDAAAYVGLLLQWYKPVLGGFVRPSNPNAVNALATVQAAYALTVYHAQVKEK